MTNCKKCSNCKEVLPVSNFVRRKFDSGSWGYTSWCKPCRNNKSKEEWKDGSIRDYVYKRKFGISLSDYEKILKSQDGKCAICQTQKPTGHGAKYGRFSVDHDHSTGEVRGLLCSNCNIGLGAFRDNVDVIKNAIFYIDRHNNGFENKQLLTDGMKKVQQLISSLKARIEALEG
jgi:hypothetical protein